VTTAIFNFLRGSHKHWKVEARGRCSGDGLLPGCLIGGNVADPCLLFNCSSVHNAGLARVHIISNTVLIQ
jgi:hypothetical protein